MRCLALLLLAACSAPAPHAAPPVAPPPAEPTASEPPVGPALPTAAPAPPPPPVDKRVDPASLPAWTLPASLPHASATRTTIYAVAADLDSLIVATTPHDAPLLARALGTRVTGRIDAPSLEAAHAAMIALAPDPAAFAPMKKLPGRGPTVNFAFAAAPLHDLLRILGETFHVNIVHPSRIDALTYDVVITAPADALVTRLVALSGLDEQHAGNITYVVPHGTHAPVAPTLRKRVIVDLDTQDATAADVVRALSALTPVPFHVACSGGAPLTINLRRVEVGAALAAISFVSGLPIEAGVATCPVDPTPAEAPPASAKVTVIAGLDLARAAILVDGGARWLETKRDRVEIGTSYISFKLADGQQDHALHPRFEDAPRWTDQPWRLAATIAAGPDTATAIAETATGTHFLATRAGLNLTIGPGVVTLANTQQPAEHALEQP